MRFNKKYYQKNGNNLKNNLSYFILFRFIFPVFKENWWTFLVTVPRKLTEMLWELHLERNKGQAVLTLWGEK